MNATGREVLERSHVVVWGAAEDAVSELAARLGRVGKLERIVRDAERAISLVAAGRVDAVVLDAAGADVFLRGIAAEAPSVGVVGVGQRTELDGGSLTDLRGALVERPYHDRELTQAVVQACSYTALGREVRALRAKLENGDNDGGHASLLGGAGGLQFSLADMARAGGLAAAAAMQVQTAAGSDGSALPVLRDARDAFERAYLQTVLVRARGNVTLASRMAGRNRTDFYELLRRRRISPSDFKK